MNWSWNVPSSVFGISTDAYDNILTINGENLGRMQNLVHHRDDAGRYSSAVFQYKGHLYYVFGTYVPDVGDVPVICSANDSSQVWLDVMTKRDSSSYSEARVWVWDYFYNSLFRNGWTGMVFTLRNVQMLDGSYATISMSFNDVFNSGIRIWIREGKQGKKNYPDYNGEGYDSFPDNVPQNLGNLLVSSSSGSFYNFAYRVNNNLGTDVQVRSFFEARTVSNFRIKEQAADTTPWYPLPQDGSFEFRYRAEDLYAVYAAYPEAWIGFQIKVNDKEMSGWWVNVQDYHSQKYIVTVGRAADGNFECTDTSESLYSSDGCNYLTLGNCIVPSNLPDCSDVYLKRKDASDPAAEWENILHYYNYAGGAIDPDQELVDYYAEAGKTYSYAIDYYDPVHVELDGSEWHWVSIGDYPASSGLGEIGMTAGTGTFNGSSNSLQFTTEPTFSADYRVGYGAWLELRYITHDSDDDAWLVFKLEKNGADGITVQQAIEDSWSANNLSGRTLYPYSVEFHTCMAPDNCSNIDYVRELIIPDGDTSYPALQIASDGVTATAVPNVWN